MDFRCPSCQRDLTVPDEYAGQLMKCPLCQNTFQAPALPPPVAPAPPPAAAPAPAPPPPAGPDTYTVAPEPLRLSAPPPQEAPPRKAEAPPAPPPAPAQPPGDYTRTRTIWISPRVVPWVAPAAALLVLLLSFFPWAGYAESGGESFLPWGWGWGRAPHWNALTFFFTLMLLFEFLASAAIVVFRLVPTLKPPAALHQIWPWRAGLVALFAFLGLFFLLVQLCIGFTPDTPTLHTTFFAWLALFVQFVVLVGALLDFWLEIRGPSRPMPRIDIHW